MWVCSQLLEAQADYHRKALAVLEKALPEMQAHQGNVTCVLAASASATSASALHHALCMHFLWCSLCRGGAHCPALHLPFLRSLISSTPN